MNKYPYWNYPKSGYAEERLIKLGIKSPKDILSLYNEEHRFYHTWEHVEDLLNQLESMKMLENDALFLATIFHDAVYNPKILGGGNEDQSSDLFLQLYDGPLKEEVSKIILDTKSHIPSSPLSAIFIGMDLNILKQPLDKLIDYENKIFKEFQFVDWKDYKKARIEVLKKLKTPEYSNLDYLISYIESRKPNIAIYSGSFAPIHVGHYNVLQKAENIFDKVIIARGKNPEKKGQKEYAFPEKIQFRQIEQFDGLLTDFIKSLGYEVTVIRGLRNATDLQSEVTQYRFLQDLDPNIKVVSIFCDKEYEYISSSAIRLLENYDMSNEQWQKYLIN